MAFDLTRALNRILEDPKLKAQMLEAKKKTIDEFKREISFLWKRRGHRSPRNRIKYLLGFIRALG